ncbi:sulfotransferase family protein [Microbulbifer harenosus]|uniref:Sulfotransferase domain-containing protein n=1 Tax=Microbulbifer harenosus TaxID=2576840 RepID=A0ABY2UEE8_9GAMM|nr:MULTISPECIES: sulfotransferase [Microbulbifer]QIL90631.1 sulfotransferase [Microbulbifer sp. SH-1]TLM75629.1 sulfotransferase domain-containing protein [Microbulbifer harenosus]
MFTHTSAKMPHFVIIGAMKSATTTLYEQLRLLDGIFMPDLKEPNFFSDDRQYKRGLDYYRKLFEAAKEGDIIGEASTHYTKLPTYPDTLKRLSGALPNAKLIYVMRHPVDRLVSQYIHEWSCNNIRVDLNEAIERHPELISYSCYHQQLTPYLLHFGAENILPVFFERIRAYPQAELTRVANFIGYTGKVCWHEALSQTNVSSERLRSTAFSRFLIKNPLLTALRRALVPAQVREAVKSRLRMRDRPQLNEANKKKLKTVFDTELAKLGDLLGMELSTDRYTEQVLSRTPDWNPQPQREKVA